MPYIKTDDRKKIDHGYAPTTAGELNYGIHLLIEKFFNMKGESYQTYNDILGALEGAKLELYRRRVAKYEDLKKEDNGDIDFYDNLPKPPSEEVLRACKEASEALSKMKPEERLIYLKKAIRTIEETT